MTSSSSSTARAGPHRLDPARRGQDAAVRFYLGAGYRILDRNWRGGDGEIDLVAVDPGGVIVFCEVTTRSSSAVGPLEDAVTATTQRRQRRLASRWLAGRRPRGVALAPVEFDVARVGPDGAGALVVDVVHDAWARTGPWSDSRISD